MASEPSATAASVPVFRPHGPVSGSLGIVADDLTGAGDAAVQFAERGWDARLALRESPRGPLSRRSVLAAITDARAMQHADSAAATARLTSAFEVAGVERLYLKIDSTMRGSVHSQIVGAIRGWSRRHPTAFVVVCPAYPTMGRTVEAGRVLVNGVPVDELGVARDPVTPVPSSALATLLPGAVGTFLAPNAPSVARVTKLVKAGQRILVADARCDADLDGIAAALRQLGPAAIAVGSAGLAAAIARIDRPCGSAGQQFASAFGRAHRVLIVISSLHASSARQQDYLAEWVSGRPELTRTSRRVTVVARPENRDTPAPLVAAALAEQAAGILDSEGIDALVLVGGDGARAVLARLDATEILFSHSLRAGAPIGMIRGGRADGLLVVTKAGGFGSATLLAEIVRDLVEPAGAVTPSSPDERTNP